MENEPEKQELVDRLREGDFRKASKTLGDRSQRKLDNLKKGIEKAAESVLGNETEALKFAERELREAIENVPALAQLAESLIIDHTPEGLRIQIVDQEKLSMFPLGSSAMYDHTKTLLGHVSTVIQSLPNRLSVSGHTDALPYAADKSYTNWELSSDRANASRRALLDSGFPAGRIARVVGLAETEPLIAEDPADPRNRRISIVILREGGATPASEKARREQETENLGAALERAFSPAAGGDQAEP